MSLRLLLILGFALAGNTVAQTENWTDPQDDVLYQAALPSGRRTAVYHIGIQGRMEGAGYRLSAVLESYPAHQAGLQRGDLLSAANGSAFNPATSFPDAAPVLLEFDRNGITMAVSVVPVLENLFDSYRTALLNSAQQFNVGNKVVAYVRLWGLSRSTNDLVSLQRVLRQLSLSDGLVLDLRDCYGFAGPEHLAMFRGAGALYTKPIALLINERTRGQLPLLVAGLADLDRVITVGSAITGTNSSPQPEQPVSQPLDESQRSDPVYQAAVDVLLGVI